MLGVKRTLGDDTAFIMLDMDWWFPALVRASLPQWSAVSSGVLTWLSNPSMMTDLGVCCRLSLLLFVLAVYAAVSIIFGVIFCLCMVGPQPRILPLNVRDHSCT